MENLDTSIKSLLKVIAQIQGQSLLGSLSLTSVSKPYWHLCVEKFHAAYIKAKNPDGFRDMFNNFFEKHLDKFTGDVVDEDGDINDEWLKNKDVLLSGKSKKKKSSDEIIFSPRNISCRGEIIYFDESNEKIRNVSIPISEAYLAACKIYADGAKNGQYSPLPAQLLHSLYNVMGFVCDNEHQKSVQNNIKALKDIVASLTDDEPESNGTGSTLNPLSGLMKTFASKFGLGGEGGFDASKIEQTVSSIFSDDMTSKMKNMFDTFTEKVNLGEAKDITSIITNVSDAMKDPSLQANLQETLSTVAAKVGLGEIKISEEDKAKINPTNVSADSQE